MVKQIFILFDRPKEEETSNESDHENNGDKQVGLHHLFNYNNNVTNSYMIHFVTCLEM